MDVAALKDCAGDVGLVGITRAKPLQRSFLVPEGGKELEGKLGPIKGLKYKVRNGFFDFYGVHDHCLTR